MGSSQAYGTVTKHAHSDKCRAVADKANIEYRRKITKKSIQEKRAFFKSSYEIPHRTRKKEQLQRMHVRETTTAVFSGRCSDCNYFKACSLQPILLLGKELSESHATADFPISF